MTKSAISKLAEASTRPSLQAQQRNAAERRGATFTAVLSSSPAQERDRPLQQIEAAAQRFSHKTSVERFFRSFKPVMDGYSGPAVGERTSGKVVNTRKSIVREQALVDHSAAQAPAARNARAARADTKTAVKK
jgi:hypothetical protein